MPSKSYIYTMNQEQEYWDGLYILQGDIMYKRIDTTVDVSSLTPIKEYPGLFATEDGVVYQEYLGYLNVKSISINKRGYPEISLGKKVVTVHKLVALAFLGPRPAGTVVCHGNDIKTDNRVVNLYYGTPQQNVDDFWRNSGHRRAPRKGVNSRAKKFTAEYILYVRSLHPSLGYKKIAKLTGLSVWAVRTIIQRNTWQHI